jgi:predicted nuclease of predicted toxin-antitoxin system
MKFLADMGISQKVVRTLRESGYDIKHLRDEGLQRLRDPQIIEKAKRENRVILTFDLDFGDLLAVSGDCLPSTIVFRLQNTNSTFVNTRLLLVLCEGEADLEAGAIVIVDDTRYRLRRLPI